MTNRRSTISSTDRGKRSRYASAATFLEPKSSGSRTGTSNKGAAFNAEGMTIPDEMQGSGYGRELMADLVDTGRLVGMDRIKLRAEQIGRYAWVKMGFRPTDDAWREMKKRPTLSWLSACLVAPEARRHGAHDQDRGWRTQDGAYPGYAGRRNLERTRSSGSFRKEAYAVR